MPDEQARCQSAASDGNDNPAEECSFGPPGTILGADGVVYNGGCVEDADHARARTEVDGQIKRRSERPWLPRCARRSPRRGSGCGPAFNSKWREGSFDPAKASPSPHSSSVTYVME